MKNIEENLPPRKGQKDLGFEAPDAPPLESPVPPEPPLDFSASDASPISPVETSKSPAAQSFQKEEGRNAFLDQIQKGIKLRKTHSKQGTEKPQ